MDIQTAKNIIQASVLADDSVLMEGSHGIGKSGIVQQFAKENGYHIEELFLSHQEVGDLIGIPHTIEIDGATITTWSKPIWLQRMEKKAEQGIPTVLFLDELNRAPIDVRQSALQLVLERQIHEHTLPIVNDQRTLVVSAMNPADDYQVDELDSALIDRFLFLKVEADAPAWLKWAGKNNVNSIVTNFIAEHPDRIHWTPKDGGIGATPRSWTKLGQYMDKLDFIEDEVLIHIMKGKVGIELASQFYQYYKNFKDVIKMEDIEKTFYDNYQTNTIEEVGFKINKLMENSEAIQKTELADQLARKYMPTDDITVFLAYLYSLENEILISFLKSYKKDEVELYKKLAAVDTALNNKKLFIKVVDAASRR